MLVLTTFDLDEYVYRALKAGASGFLLKDVTREQLVHGVRTIAAGDSLLAPAITQRLIADFCHGPQPGTLPEAATVLSERELERTPTPRTRTLKRRDRRDARRQRSDRQKPRRPRAGEAQSPRPSTNDRLRLRNRPRQTRQHLGSPRRTTPVGCQYSRRARESAVSTDVHRILAPHRRTTLRARREDPSRNRVNAPHRVATGCRLGYFSRFRRSPTLRVVATGCARLAP